MTDPLECGESLAEPPMLEDICHLPIGRFVICQPSFDKILLFAPLCVLSVYAMLVFFPPHPTSCVWEGPGFFFLGGGGV